MKPTTKPSILCDWCRKKRSVEGARFEENGQWILCKSCKGIDDERVWARVKPSSAKLHGVSPELVEMEERLQEVEPYIWSFAHMAERRGVDIEDAVQEGRLIALEALKEYDPDRGATFGTFVYGKLKHELPNRFINEYMRTIRIPQWVHEDVLTPIDRMVDLKTQEDATEPLENDLITDPRLKAELQRRADIRWKGSDSTPVITDEKVREWVELYMRQTSGIVVSLDEPHIFEEVRQIPSDGSEMTAVVEESMMNESVKEALGMLSPPHRVVLEGRFGIAQDTNTLREIAEQMELSPERIRQIEKEAIEILREHPKARRILADWT